MPDTTPADQLRAVIDVLDDAESYLSAMHDAVGRHDHIGANLTCGGCALNARLRPALAVARQLLGTTEGAGAAAVPSTAAMLATPCDACDHTLNWHRNDVGCTVPRCVCGRFQDAVEPTALPAPVDRAARAEPPPAELIRDSVAERLKDCVWLTVDDEPMALAESWPDARALIDAIHTAAGLDAAPPAPADRAATGAEFELRGTDEIRAAVLAEAAEVAHAEGERLYGEADVEEAKAAWGVEILLRRAAAEAAVGVQPPTTSEAGLSYRLEHRRLGDTAWQRNTPGIGANWSWQSREKAAQRLAEARDRWPDFEHQLIETTTTVTEQPAAPAAPEEPTR